MSARRAIVGMAAWLGVWAGWAAPASAEANVERGCALVQRGEFRDALESFERAERGTGLDRDAVVRLLECRALARFATRDLDALDHDLVRLVSLDPGHELSDDFGPEVHARLARVRARGVSGLEVHVELERDAGLARVLARVDGDEGALVSAVRVRARAGRGPWREGDGEVELAAGAGVVVEYEARAIGPGGAELEQARGRAGVERAAPAVARRPRRAPPATTRSRSLWPWLVAGAGVAVAIGVTAAVLASQSSDHTQPSAPLVGWDLP